VFRGDGLLKKRERVALQTRIRKNKFQPVFQYYTMFEEVISIKVPLLCFFFYIPFHAVFNIAVCESTQ